MKFYALPAALALALNLTILSFNLSAQSGITSTRPHPDTDVKANVSELDQKAMNQLGVMSADFWTPKLNQYKTSIDRALPTAELNKLNKLRVRFGILTAEMLASLKSMQNKNEAVESDGSDTQFNIEGLGMMVKLQEIMSIYKSAKELGTRNQDVLEALKQNIVTDVVSFMDNVSAGTQKFVEQNRTAMIQEKGTDAPDQAVNGVAKVAAELRTEKGRKGIRSAYDGALEPIVLLYNGADLAELLNQVTPFAPLPREVAQTGISMPENAVLKQNVPNPASASTTITYNLPEPATEVTLRIYSTSGAELAKFREGAQAAGTHQRVVDVGNMPPGSYLYHLTVLTARGEQVYSKAMQVVR